jgi:L-threonylcarbamoyladenylate synthase
MRVLVCPQGPRSNEMQHCDDCALMTEVEHVLGSKGLVVYPTDTVYGLAGKALDPVAIEKVSRAKGRPEASPLPVAVASTKDISMFSDVPASVMEKLGSLEGRPITWVLPARGSVPKRLLGGTDNIGIRVLPVGCAASMIRRVGPITATSANLHGDPPPRTMEEALSSLGNGIDIYLQCGPTSLGTPSTVVEVGIGPKGRNHGKAIIHGVRIIREGAVKGTLIEDILLG